MSRVVDANGNELAVGDEVSLKNAQDIMDAGLIELITEPEDIYAPRVRVLFYGGDRDSFPCQDKRTWHTDDELWQCEELVKGW